MRRMILAAAGMAFLFLALFSDANAEITWDKDYGGYSIRLGSTVYHHRGSSSSTYTQLGRVGIYNADNGTSGTSYYSNSGRFDSYSNNREGWNGSGYTPYRYPAASTYRRYYTSPSSR